MSAYKNMLMSVPVAEYDSYKRFFESKGGFTKFVKEAAKEHGFFRDEDLIEAAKRVKNRDYKEYLEMEGTLNDGLENL